ncbi:MAG TPA: beta-propeller domain-containing protein [Rhizomicrobium sp.]
MHTQSEKPARRSNRMALSALFALLCAAGAAGLSMLGDSGARAAHAATLTAFTSEADLRRYLQHLPRRYPPPPSPPPPPPAAGAVESVAAAAPATPGITNVQEAGVDEGDIVKLHGDTLVVLRRGRLFTVSLSRGVMRPVDSIDAYPPGVDARGDWYDEMLIAQDRIVVIGYSYSRGGTQINRFHIDSDGHLKFEDAYQLRSNDYYSARNYASRLIGNRLIVYSPRYLPYVDGDPLQALPALRRWNPAKTNGAFERIGTAREVYLSPGLPADQITAVHTVVSCDLAAVVLQCKATSVFGPDGRSFYVSTHAVYVWVSPYWGQGGPGKRAASLLYRLPLDGGAPSAVGVRGAPVDQFSFREDAADGILNVLVRGDGGGDAMWAPEFSAGSVMLMRAPLRAFGDGMGEVEAARYRALPRPADGNSFHNRFAGDTVLYGDGNDWGTPESYSSVLYAAPLHGGPVTQLALPHPVDRIELMGRDAVVVGSDRNNVYFSAVVLAPGSAPVLGDRYVLTGAAQSETRSHGFFFNPQAGSDSDGVLGLPVSRPARAAYRQLTETSAAVMFLRRSHGQFAGLGELAADEAGAADDHCVASCVDWYGNARPIFIGARTFALMGYELVEGAIGQSEIREAGRASFAPRPLSR